MSTTIVQPRLEYGNARVSEIQVKTVDVGESRPAVESVEIQGRQVKPTKRFWNSLHMRFGFTANIFRYFTHAEVFERISQVAPNDQLRFCIETDAKGTERALAVSNPGLPIMENEELIDLLRPYTPDQLNYHDGVVSSRHSTRLDDRLQIAGDDFKTRFVLEVPVDGFGRPVIFLSLLRLVCQNGAVGYNQAFRSELSLGRGEDRVEYALTRALDSFSNEEGFAALAERFSSAAQSWASVAETQRLYKILTRVSNEGQLMMPEFNAGRFIGHDGDSAPVSPLGSSLFGKLQRVAGDFTTMYGLANMDTLSVKRQRTLPSRCKVYDLINFASEAATHHVKPGGQKYLQAYIGELVAHEYDLEGTAERFGDFQDFFIENRETTETLAGMHRR